MTDNRGSGGEKGAGGRRGGRNFETGQVKQSFSNRRTRTVQVERRISKTGPSRTGPSGTGLHAPQSGGKTEGTGRNQQVGGEDQRRANINMAGVSDRTPAREGDVVARDSAAAPSESKMRHEEDQAQTRPRTDPSSSRPARTGGAGGGAGGGRAAANKGAGGKAKVAPPRARDPVKRVSGNKNTLKKIKPSFDERKGKLTISEALDEADVETERRRGRSLAAIKRAREKEREKAIELLKSGKKVVREVNVPESLTVTDLANRMAERLGDVVRVLVGLGITATANEVIDADSAELVVAEFGHKAKRVDSSMLETKLEEEDNASYERFPRPPIVTLMGHVDHGKTSLLDALRKSQIALSEAGGITQHVGAWRVALENDRSITFLDTPGHEAFSLMRARGASATDLVVLVVAADDGVRAQTVEAINHAKAADVSLIVGISKCDLPGANIPAVMDGLESRGVLVEEKGGEVLCVPFSSQTGEGIDKLLEALLLQSDMTTLTAARQGVCKGVVIESRVEKGYGILATLLLQEGVLRKGDIVLAGARWGRIRVMLDENGKPCDEAMPSQPVQVAGLQGHLHAGETFRTMAKEARAKEIGEHRAEQEKAKGQVKSLKAVVQPESMLQVLEQAERDAEVQRFPFLVKADAHGTLEVVLQSLENIELEGAEIVLLHGEVGGITESDIALAAASGGQVLGFNAKPTAHARVLAKSLKVETRFYSVLYELLEAVEGTLRKTLAPKTREIKLGLAEVKQVFPIGKVGNIAGAAVLDGIVRRGARARVLRGEEKEVVYEGRVRQLKRFKEEVREIAKGAECGIAFENFQDLAAHDRIECFRIEQIEETQSSTSP